MSTPKLTPEFLRSLRASIPPEVAEDADLRETLILEARKLQLALEKANNVSERVCFQVCLPISYQLVLFGAVIKYFKVVDTVAISAAIKMGLFKAMQAGQAYSIRDLATATKSDPLLVGMSRFTGRLDVKSHVYPPERILRMCAAFGSVDQRDVDNFELNTVSETFRSPLNEAAVETW